VGAVVLALTLVARPAHADPEGDAKALFSRGRALRAAGDCASAVPLFRQASAVFPAGLGSLRNEAECEETRGKLVSARRAWRNLATALTSHTDSRYDGWMQDAERAIARLGARIGTVVVDVEVVGPDGSPRSRDGTVIAMNGEALDKSSIGIPIERDPATYSVRVTVGGQTEEQRVGIAPGESTHLKFRLVLSDAASRVTPAPQPPPHAPEAAVPPRGSGSDGWRIAGWTSIGVGAASLAGWGIAGLVRGNALHEYNQLCGVPPHCPRDSDAAEIRHRGLVAQTLTYVFSTVGFAGVVAGGAMLIAAPGPRARTALVIGPSGVSIEGVF